MQGYQKRFAELIHEFRDKNDAYLNNLSQDPYTLDIKEVMGALVVTFDSSKGIPKALAHMDEKNRGEYTPTDDYFLGLCVVDINPEKRVDVVTPTMSAVHELQHHALAMTDYLESQDTDIDMQSSYRKGRIGPLYGYHSGRITTAQSYANDAEKYSKLLGREFNYQYDSSRVQAQLDYLDELHSSYLQRKPNWFNAAEKVYALSSKGAHWELVGNHPDDREAAKRVLAYLQGFYLCDSIQKSWNENAAQGKMKLGAGQEKFIDEFADVYRRVGSLIGVARTIRQAKTFIQAEWEEFRQKYPQLLESKPFTDMLNVAETKDPKSDKSWGVEGLRSKLIK